MGAGALVGTFPALGPQHSRFRSLASLDPRAIELFAVSVFVTQLYACCLSRGRRGSVEFSVIRSLKVVPD